MTTPVPSERSRRFDRRPGLPTGRSLVGGLLVAAAALGAFAVTSGESEAPLLPLRAVAGRAISPGERLTAADLRLEPAALPAHDAALFDGVDALEGATALAPLDEGDVVQASAVRDSAGPAGADDHEVAVRLETAHALAGRLQPGERVDVLATFGTGEDAETRHVAQAAVVLGIDPIEGLGGGSGELVVTLAVSRATSAIEVTHAAVAGRLTLVRAPADGGREGGEEPADGIAETTVAAGVAADDEESDIQPDGIADHQGPATDPGAS